MKNLTQVLATVCFILLSFFFGDEYLDFQGKKEVLKTVNQQTQKQAEAFSLTDIKELENTEFIYTPYKIFLDQIIEKLKNTKNSIQIEVYMLTETRIKQELLRAKKRGLHVQVVLEKNPYMASSINKKTFSELQAAGVDVVWSSTKNYRLNHAKMMILDHSETIVSSGNFTYSTFAHNRDFFIISKDEKLVTQLDSVFQNDFAGINKQPYGDNLVLSPSYSRNKFETLLRGAKNEIVIYMQYLKDDGLNQLLLKLKKEKDIDIRIILDANGMKDEIITKLQKAGINIQEYSGKKMHAKAIGIDKQYLFIGSVNASKSSLDDNREIGVLLKNPEILETFYKLFERDFIGKK